MTYTIRKTATLENWEDILKQVSRKKGFQAYQYCGTVPVRTNILELQKKWRDEWQ